MAFAGKCDKKENITAAVAANIWMSNEKSARSAFLDESLQYIVMDCEVWHSQSTITTCLQLVYLITEFGQHQHNVESSSGT